MLMLDTRSTRKFLCWDAFFFRKGTRWKGAVTIALYVLFFIAANHSITALYSLFICCPYPIDALFKFFVAATKLLRI